MNTEKNQPDPEKSLPSSPPSIAGKGRDSLSFESMDLSPYMQSTRDAVAEQGIIFHDQSQEDSDEIDLLGDTLDGMVRQCRTLQEGWELFQVAESSSSFFQRRSIKKENDRLVNAAVKDLANIVQSITNLEQVLDDDKLTFMAGTKNDAEKSQTVLQIDRALTAIDMALTFPAEKKETLESLLGESRRFVELRSSLLNFRNQLTVWRKHFDAS